MRFWKGLFGVLISALLVCRIKTAVRKNYVCALRGGGRMRGVENRLDAGRKLVYIHVCMFERDRSQGGWNISRCGWAGTGLGWMSCHVGDEAQGFPEPISTKLKLSVHVLACQMID